MHLVAFHRVLIVATICFDVFFTVFCVRKYNRNGDAWELIMGFGSTLVTIALVAYLIYFNKKVNRIKIEMAARDRMCPQCRYDLHGSLASRAAACPECGFVITDSFRTAAARVSDAAL